jgi:hypothetical protein
MPSLETGLRHRIGRLVEQIARQHRYLQELRTEIDVALERGSRADARRGLDQFSAALTAHFELEQNVFFPALHGLEPTRKRDLEALEQEHAVLLAELQDVRTAVESAVQADSAARFRSCLERLRSHERIEEELVAAIASGAEST